MKGQNAESINVGKNFSARFLGRIELSVFSMILSVFVFFIARAALPNGIVPFGYPAFCAVITSKRQNMDKVSTLLYGLLVLIGTLTLGQIWQAFIVCFSMIIFYVIMAFDDRMALGDEEGYSDSDKPRLPLNAKLGLVLFFSGAVPCAIALSVKGAIVADVFALVLQLVIFFVVFFVFRTTLDVFQDEVSKKLMTNEELACIAITIAIALMGLWDVVLIGLSLKRVLCITMIMIFSYRGGLGTGAASGVVVGILLTASTMSTGGQFSATIISLYAFCGFLAGLFNRYKKVGVSLGFFLGNFILSILLTATPEIIINVYEIFFAMIIFIIIPSKFTEFLKLPQLTGVKIPTVRVNYAEKLRQVASERLNGFAGILSKMSEVCREINTHSVENTQKDMVQIIDRITDRVCAKCALNSDCWERNFYKSFQGFTAVTEILESKGRVLPEEVPRALSSKCPNLNSILFEAKNAFEIWRIERLWRKRVEECKSVLPAQLLGMSEILTSLADEVDLSVNFVESLEKDIMREFALQDLKIRNVTVSRNKYGRYEVVADVKCCKSKKQCIYSYQKIISKVVGVPMALQTPTCQNTGDNLWCTLVYTEEEPLSISVKVQSVKAHGSAISGDSYLFTELDKGIYLVCLSDGMGSGEIARKQSESVITLIELFMESGLSFPAAVSMIDSLLETGVDKVMSATVDLAVFDLYQGVASFMKLGAVPSVIKKKDKVETVVIASLPMGFVQGAENEYQTVARNLAAGDYVILLSDGVVEAFREANYTDIEFYAYIESIKAANPQNIADLIIEKAMELSDDTPKDDMTVIVSKIWQKG